ncbi:hypothetical protein [Acutalibacter sp.]|uniref:hypothetical protein n=1 Tax=Acutalibacter sp. TaxID=1918636 RepID=UPI0034DE7560
MLYGRPAREREIFFRPRRFRGSAPKNPATFEKVDETFTVCSLFTLYLGTQKKKPQGIAQGLFTAASWQRFHAVHRRNFATQNGELFFQNNKELSLGQSNKGQPNSLWSRSSGGFGTFPDRFLF